MEHRSLVALDIRENIRIWNELQQPEEEDELSLFQFGNIYLGSRQPPCSLETLCQSRSDDAAFSGFKPQLTNFVNEILQRRDLPQIRFQPHDKVRHNIMSSDSESALNFSLICGFLS